MKTIKKILKWTGIILLSVVLIFALVVVSMQNKKYDAPYPEIKVSTDSLVIEHGKNLVYGPAHCAYCHSTIDKMAALDKGEIVPLSGGFEFKLPIGKLYSRNLTPDMETGIGKLTDAELVRTLRYGVGSDGRVILDLMPFQHLSEDDMTAVISFLRSQKPISNKVPKNEYNLLGKIIVPLLVKPVSPTREILKSIEPSPTPEYGKYLSESVANCRGCHTKRDLQTGAYIGTEFAGGLTIEADQKPGTFLTTPNLTPDKETGVMANWDLEKFKSRFRQGKLIPFSIMPWGPFSRMSDTELEAIFRYINTLEPVKNDVGPIITTPS